MAKQDRYNAFISVVDELAPRARANGGPLAGMAFAVKDNLDTVGLPTTANTPALVDNLRVQDNPVVALLKQAGAELIGKTSMHELAFGATTSAGAFPAAKNPRDPNRSPGGSSGGSSAAVAAGIVPFALGTDTGGSVSVPAAWCGVYGYRPTTGRWPGEGAVTMSSTRDTVGVIAESLALVAQIDAIVVGGTPVTTPAATPTPAATEILRIGIPSDDSAYVAELDDDVRAVWDRTVDRLMRDAAVSCVVIDTDEIHELNASCGMGIVLHECVRELETYLATVPGTPTLSSVVDAIAAPDVKRTMTDALMNEAHYAAQYPELMHQRRRLQLAFDELYAGNALQVLLYPTSPITATALADDHTTRAFGRQVDTFQTAVRNTAPGSLSGQPAVALPAGTGHWGRPVGISLEGTRGNDSALLEFARRIDDMLART